MNKKITKLYKDKNKIFLMFAYMIVVYLKKKLLDFCHCHFCHHCCCSRRHNHGYCCHCCCIVALVVIVAAAVVLAHLFV